MALKSVPGRDTSSRGDVRRRQLGGLLTRSGCSPVRWAMGRHGRFDSKIFESAHHFRIESGDRFKFESNLEASQVPSLGVCGSVRVSRVGTGLRLIIYKVVARIYVQCAMWHVTPTDKWPVLWEMATYLWVQHAMWHNEYSHDLTNHVTVAFIVGLPILFDVLCYVFFISFMSYSFGLGLEFTLGLINHV